MRAYQAPEVLIRWLRIDLLYVLMTRMNGMIKATASRMKQMHEDLENPEALYSFLK